MQKVIFLLLITWQEVVPLLENKTWNHIIKSSSNGFNHVTSEVQWLTGINTLCINLHPLHQRFPITRCSSTIPSVRSNTNIPTSELYQQLEWPAQLHIQCEVHTWVQSGIQSILDERTHKMPCYRCKIPFSFDKSSN